MISNLTKMLGEEWTGISHFNRTPPDVGIITRHEVCLSIVSGSIPLDYIINKSTSFREKITDSFAFLR